MNVTADIQHLIFKRAIGDSAANLATWKDRLVLLAVCREWRALALPLAYRQAFICSNIYHSHCALAPAEAKPSTNLDLLQANHGAELVRVLEIELVHTVGLEVFLAHAVRLLQRGRWQRVTSLKLRVYAGSDDARRPGECDPVLAHYARWLRRLLPAVARLAVSGGCGGASAELLGRVANAYARQLTRLHADVPLALAAKHASAELTHLKLGFSAHASQLLPRIAAQTLVRLELYGLGGAFPWTRFSAGPHAPHVIRFDNLRCLEVSYGAAFADDAHEMRDANSRVPGLELHFPKLQRLRIAQCPPDCVLLAAGRFPEFLAQARIYGSARAVELVERSRLRRMGRLAINVHALDAAAHADFYRATGRLLGAASAQAACASLYVARHVVLAHPELADWGRLTKLLVMSPLEARHMLRLLARLPALLSFVSFRTDVADVARCCSQAVAPEPRAHRLERLGVIYDADTCLESEARALLEYLLVQLGNLHTFTVPDAHLQLAKKAARRLNQGKVAFKGHW
ncbi:hypothetical protein H4S02_000493 [Coemansia sp. RSA 2611]|nr:hypothetical protein IWW54_000698 [Coemansia sp. RSA 2705]KAJ2321687.1 hypothetical protein IWW52_000591 [Coemansia sp. RSA 2704]KAJ2323562.1 hypothetical protein IWW51_003695 [Coemansia sp. RSA 2702]KAJ2369767.1 hypothetical protein H4S01_000795 [Coemansia sp. RSA 2610]KAJ2392959.1 hypothetical protein H4S02_000493 [Coemansia sp. RSA 2611]KAJ2739368.1 hypothetical protein H4R23_000518 [Coemansia sp. Cherry 401B]